MKKLIATIAILIVSVSTAQAFDPNSFCGMHDEMIAKVTGERHNEKLIAVFDDKLFGGVFELFANQANDARNSYTVFRTIDGETCIISAGDVVDIPNKTEDERMIAMLDENDGHLYEIYRDAETATFGMYRTRYSDRQNPEVVAGGDVLMITEHYKGDLGSGL